MRAYQSDSIGSSLRKQSLPVATEDCVPSKAESRSESGRGVLYKVYAMLHKKRRTRA